MVSFISVLATGRNPAIIAAKRYKVTLFVYEREQYPVDNLKKDNFCPRMLAVSKVEIV